ncbi:hypothetical protein [Chryseosolibacter indicus]|uniref:Uncharacterized protein n=1 Tax=Chryseosolibacter indicus TaxID=2782351 RepID=A0ABS5VKN7_9BACT|nr:hypothetical protein [Chryseosolibacter indicus]MBT1702012.1 hypothetical protein [Chryseosolibacter indicus]
MKRSFSILFLVIFLFNVGGYYLVFWALRYQANAELNSRLDQEDYSADQTVELKIPLTIPYPMHPRGFERVHGKFEHQGEFYQLVKQKLQNDTLYVICYKDHEEKQLMDTMTDYVSLSNDLPGTAKKALNFFGKLLKDFESGSDLALIASDTWCLNLTFSFSHEEVISASLSVLAPPPKA